MIKAILFDLDDLMVNSAPLHFEASRRVFERFGVDVMTISEDEVRSYFGKRVSEITQLIVDYFNIGRKVDVGALISEREEIFLELIRTDLSPMPGLFELVGILKKLNYRRAVASSGTKRYINEVLAKLGLADFFETVVSGDMVKNGKPDPEIFLRAAEALKVKPSECVVLEDSTHGIVAAKAAGMFCIGVKNPLSEYIQDISMADRKVGRLDEIDEKLLKSFR